MPVPRPFGSGALRIAVVVISGLLPVIAMFPAKNSVDPPIAKYEMSPFIEEASWVVVPSLKRTRHSPPSAFHWSDVYVEELIQYTLAESFTSAPGFDGFVPTTVAIAAPEAKL